jgi:hypothetical protein
LKKPADLISTSSCRNITFSAWECHNHSGENWSSEIRSTDLNRVLISMNVFYFWFHLDSSSRDKLFISKCMFKVFLPFVVLYCLNIEVF